MPYPCPETLIYSVPRCPCSKNVYEKTKVKENCVKIAKAIKFITEKLKPKKLIIVGIKYSPTCGVFHTSYSEDFDVDKIKPEEYDEIKKKMLKKEGEGILFEILKKEINAIYIEVYKDDFTDLLKVLFEI